MLSQVLYWRGRWRKFLETIQKYCEEEGLDYQRILAAWEIPTDAGNATEADLRNFTQLRKVKPGDIGLTPPDP
jgi:hypothetical protein